MMNNVFKNILKILNKNWKIVIAVIVTAIISGGGVYLWHSYLVHRSVLESMAGERSKLHRELQHVRKLHADLSRLKKTYNLEKEWINKTHQELNQQISELQSRLEKLQWPYVIEEKMPGNFFKVYDYDVGKQEEVCFYVTMPERLPLAEKLEFLAQILSKCKFHDHPIDLLRMENRKNKKIAIIELKEPDFPHAYTWRGGYFQGSAGGYATSIALVKTFLQEDYKGDWIDGVEFYYGGKPISSDWDHIFLDGTKYRNLE